MRQADSGPVSGGGGAGDLDRLDALRGDSGALPWGARVLTVSGHRVLLDADGRLLTHAPADGVGGDAAPVLLGEAAGVRWAARSVPESSAAEVASGSGGRFESLRTAVAVLPALESALAFYAAGLLAWHGGALHCGRCGAPTRSTRSGHQRECTAAGCSEVLFPRTDPAIITLVRRGERALLGRQPSWPEGRFSTLAGFVEPGETLEQAVAREVREEVGLAVERVVYFGSQPWPFPHSLMVGFRSEAAAGEVALGDELAEARWFTRRSLRAALASGEVTLPPPHAISRALIEDWLGGEVV